NAASTLEPDPRDSLEVAGRGGGGSAAFCGRAGSSALAFGSSAIIGAPAVLVSLGTGADAAGVGAGSVTARGGSPVDPPQPINPNAPQRIHLIAFMLDHPRRGAPSSD